VELGDSPLVMLCPIDEAVRGFASLKAPRNLGEFPAVDRPLSPLLRTQSTIGAGTARMGKD
jgi:hypothetical protein